MEQKTISKEKTPSCQLAERCINASEKGRDEGVFSPYVSQSEETCHLVLHVDGIRCGKCIHSIESALKNMAGVIQARVNMSTSRASISWAGSSDKADDLVKCIETLGYKTTAVAPPTETKKKTEEAALLRYMAIAGFAMGNIMLISVALWSNSQGAMGEATQKLLHWVSALIALPTIIYAGRPFFASAIGALKHRRTNMDVPISLALILASIMSVAETIYDGKYIYFDSATMLLFFLLIGRWLDAKARGKARAHATELLALLQGSAAVLEGDKIRYSAIADLKEGEIVLVAAGEKMPTDIEVIEGESDINTSLVTGESTPQQVSQHDTVFGGTINLTAPLTCRVLKVSDQSLLAEVVRLMENAEQGRARYVRLADKAARLYTPVIHSLALAAFLGWYLLGGIAWQDALIIAITTLIITCPCALGLAVPVVQVLAVEWLMKRGILVKTGDALERLTQIDTVVLDKTGTVTYGTPYIEMKGVAREHIALAASLADYSKHPISRAMSHAYQGKRFKIKEVKEVAGVGIEGNYKGEKVFLGRADNKIAPKKRSAIILKVNGRVAALFPYSDCIREDAKKTVAAFQAHAITPYLLSGDKKEITADMANTLHIQNYHGEVLPNEKLEIIKSLQSDGKKLLMVGDGLNDAPALAQANISLSPSSGMDLTQNTADMVFQGESLYAAFLSWKIARFSTSLVKQNFMLAVLYNICAIPLAFMGVVTPLVAAIAMSASSLIVVGNSFRLRMIKK